MRKAVRLELSEAQRLELERGYHRGEKHCFRMRCLAVLLKAEGLSAAKVGERTEIEQHTSPQLYEYKVEKLQELEQKAEEGKIELYYGDESHVCTEGYVPYGWQFPGEDVHVPPQKIARLNIFGMTTRDNQYEGFTSREGITAEKVADFLDKLSLRPRTRNTVIVLDNASIHRSRLIKEMRPVWESRGLFLFYLPPYSPHLNIAETLWRMLKGKWIRPQDYESTDSLFYATNRALASVGTSLFINHSHYAA